jgi:hypothetical protein
MMEKSLYHTAYFSTTYCEPVCGAVEIYARTNRRLSHSLHECKDHTRLAQGFTKVATILAIRSDLGTEYFKNEFFYVKSLV